MKEAIEEVEQSIAERLTCFDEINAKFAKHNFDVLFVQLAELQELEVPLDEKYQDVP